jgi:hypothetical protein
MFVCIQEKGFTDETKSLLDEYLDDAIIYQGVDCECTGHANFHLRHFYYGIIKTLHTKDAKVKHLKG